MATSLAFDPQAGTGGATGGSYLNSEQYNTFGDAANQFGGTVNQFAGTTGNLSQTIQDAVNSPTPKTTSDPFSAASAPGSADLGKQEQTNYKEFHDDYFAQQAAKKAYDAKASADRYSYFSAGDDGGVRYTAPFYWNLTTVPNWVLGKGVTIPEGSTFRNPANTGQSTSQTSPYQAWFEFQKKYKENPDYDMYTGEYHKDYYPKEWLDMARYWDYRAANS